MVDTIPKSSINLAQQLVKNHLKEATKMNVSVGLISGALQIADMIKNKNYVEYAKADIGVAKSGVCRNLLDLGQTVYAKASAFEAEAGFGGLAGVGVSALSAGAHSEYGQFNWG